MVKLNIAQGINYKNDSKNENTFKFLKNSSKNTL